MLHEARATRIVQDVEARLGQRALGALLLAQDAVVRLLLQLELAGLTLGRQFPRKVGP